MHLSKLISLPVLFLLLCGTLVVSAQSDPHRDPRQPGDAALIARLDRATGGGAQIFRHAATGKARFIGAPSGQPIQQPSSLAAATPEQASRAFLDAYGPLFGLRSPDRELSVMQQTTLLGRSFVRYQQVYQGVPILGGELVVQTDQQRAVITANGEALPDLQIPVQPSLAPEAAIQIALSAIARAYHVQPAKLAITTPQLWVYNPQLLGAPGLPISRLVWRMEVSAARQPIRELVLIDAHKGVVVLHFNQIADAKNRRVCNDNNLVDADGNQDNDCTPAKYARVEGQGPTGVVDVDKAYEYSGATYDYFFKNFGRDSLDGKGLPLISLVKYCFPGDSCPYENAFWDGKQMTYGDGFASADDVVGHELSHGFTEFTSHLFYYYQSGAINESLSDIFGELIDLTDGVGTDTASKRWLVGEDLPSSIGAIRDMANPPLFGDPDKITSPYYTADSSGADSGGVHTNSGVNNKAAYLMTDGGTFNGQTIRGLGVEKVGAIYYTLEVAFLTSGSDYQDLFTDLPAACNTLAASGKYGMVADDCAQVQKVVAATQMNTTPPVAPTPTAPVCPAGQAANRIFFDDVENASSGKWTMSASSGANAWYYPANTNPFGLDLTYTTSGLNSIWGDDPGSAQAEITPVDSSLSMNQSVLLPPNAYMHFNHAFGFDYDKQSNGTIVPYDGGVIEYSADGGASWSDAGPLIGDNGYNGAISTLSSNPLIAGNPRKARPAYVATSNGYMSSRLNLGALAGQRVRFRFRIGTDEVFGGEGWFIDDVQIYTCDSTPAASLQVPSAKVPENTGGTAIQLRLSNVTDQSVSVPIAVSGTATENVDYQLSSTAFIIPAGSSSATVMLRVVNDQIPEPDETVILTLGTPVNATLQGGTTTTITIWDSTNLHQLHLPLVGASEP